MNPQQIQSRPPSLGMTQGQLAHLIGVDARTWRRWEMEQPHTSPQEPPRREHEWVYGGTTPETTCLRCGLRRDEAPLEGGGSQRYAPCHPGASDTAPSVSSARCMPEPVQRLLRLLERPGVRVWLEDMVGG